jgi:hypothetical protein
MWQKIKKGLQVLAIIGIVYFIYRILFVHLPDKDLEKLLASFLGLFACGNIIVDCEG